MAELNTEFTPEDSHMDHSTVLVRKSKSPSRQCSLVALWAGAIYLLVVYCQGTQTGLQAAAVGTCQLVLLAVVGVELWTGKTAVGIRVTDWILLGTSLVQVLVELLGWEGAKVLKLAVLGRVLTAAYRLQSAKKLQKRAIQQINEQLKALLQLPESQRQRKVYTGLVACVETVNSLRNKENSAGNEGKTEGKSLQTGFDFFENEVNAKEFAVFSEVGSIDFNIFTLKGLTHNCPLHALGGYLLLHRGLCARLQIPFQAMNSLLVALETAYNPLPYHSSTHAADVLQAVHVFVKSDLTHMEELVLYVAAAAHDVGHPGRNNAFLVNTRDPLAVLYNDKSVLENYHVSTLFALATEPKNAIFARFSSNDYKQVRATCIEMILSTDISEHSRLLSAVQSSPLLPAQPHKLRSLHLSFLLHAGDISNPVRRWSLAHAWTQLILEECFDQGDEERRLELPVGPLNDRNLAVAKCQIGFIEHLVEPTFAILAEMMPATQGLKEALERNKEAWKQKA